MASEIGVKHFMTKKEQRVKEELIKLLRSKRHSKYAARFEMLDLNLVPIKTLAKGDEHFVACISFDDATVYINEALVDSGPTVFAQLDMILRHELAHNLLMHQVRMLKQLGQDTFLHVKFSQLLHNLWNIIEDDEISNTRYSEADKLLCRNLYVNGAVIRGLVTEDHRPDWQTMSVEEMYFALLEEIKNVNTSVQRYLKNGWGMPSSKDFITGNILGTYIYVDMDSPSVLLRPMDVFIKSSKTFKNYPKHLQDMIIAVYEALKDADPEDIKHRMERIVQSSPVEAVGLLDTSGKTITTIYTPEEKYIIMNVLKNMIGNIQYDPITFKIKRATHSKEYVRAYNKTMRTFDKTKFDDDKLQDILKSVLEIAQQQASNQDEDAELADKDVDISAVTSTRRSDIGGDEQ